MATKKKIGFMQGRLSPRIDGKIQAFPWPYWQAEFPQAQELGLGHMEWTLDQDRIFENPLMTNEGRDVIRRLSQESDVAVSSLTGDCFMQAPFWKASGDMRAELIDTFEKVLLACADIGMTYMVVPLVDNGAIQSAQEKEVLINTLNGLVPVLRAHKLVIAFELDFPPKQQAEFIAQLPTDCFGINFDMGNSASLGWNPSEEIPVLAKRIVNVHVKDRILGGTTVPFGEGAVDFAKVFSLLKSIEYKGNYILQSARASDGQDFEVLGRYVEFVAEQIGH
jgi:hexulose-6-phosphate isomerase